MRLLYLKNQRLLPGQVRALGSFVHFPLMRELAQACKALDSKYIEEMARGFPVVGPIPRSGRWNPREAIPDLPQADLDERAWEIRREVISSAQRKKRIPALEKVWENTLDEVKRGFCLGPFSSEESVSNYLGTEQWIATERFAREQKNKVRGVATQPPSARSTLHLQFPRTWCWPAQTRTSTC